MQTDYSFATPDNEEKERTPQRPDAPAAPPYPLKCHTHTHPFVEVIDEFITMEEEKTNQPICSPIKRKRGGAQEKNFSPNTICSTCDFESNVDNASNNVKTSANNFLKNGII